MHSITVTDTMLSMKRPTWKSYLSVYLFFPYNGCCLTFLLILLLLFQHKTSSSLSFTYKVSRALAAPLRKKCSTTAGMHRLSTAKRINTFPRPWVPHLGKDITWSVLPSSTCTFTQPKLQDITLM